jgi:hypothetical protein
VRYNLVDSRKIIQRSLEKNVERPDFTDMTREEAEAAIGAWENYLCIRATAYSREEWAAKLLILDELEDEFSELFYS